MRRGALVALAAIVLASPFAPGPTSLARFTDADTTTASFGTGSLAAPTSLAGTGGATTATLMWTPSVTAAATGYRVQRSATSGSGYAQVGTVTPVSAATTTDIPGNGTWYYILRTYLQGWTSAASNEASVFIGATTATGFKSCTTTAPVTSGAGDNNGYELNTARGCVVDGVVATDANSGTNVVNSCSNAGKDRHLFWGYAFGLPATVTSVDGITIRATAGLNNNGGTTLLCVELSQDGGGTWTAAKTVTFSGSALTAYTFGGATDTWGASWTSSALGAANLRIRVTDVTTQPNKDFRLDGLEAQVHYKP